MKIVLLALFVQQMSFASQSQESQSWYDILQGAQTFEEYKNARKFVGIAIEQKHNNSQDFQEAQRVLADHQQWIIDTLSRYQAQPRNKFEQEECSRAYELLSWQQNYDVGK